MEFMKIVSVLSRTVTSVLNSERRKKNKKIMKYFFGVRMLCTFHLLSFDASNVFFAVDFPNEEKKKKDP